MTAACEMREVAPDDPDALGLLDAYFEELRARLGAFEPPTLEELRADGARGVTLVAYERGAPVACGSIRALDASTAEVKRMFVAPAARGRGHAKRLLLAPEDRARARVRPRRPRHGGAARGGGADVPTRGLRRDSALQRQPRRGALVRKAPVRRAT